MPIGYLSDHPALAPSLAAAHTEAFRDLLPGWSMQEALDELHTHTRRCAIPTTLVALGESADEPWIGSVSLLRNDSDRIRKYSPWLGSLYVVPSARGRGIGRMLVERCVAEAAALGVSRLHLYCMPDLAAFYLALGWERCDRVALDHAEVEVFAIVPRSEPPA